MKLAVLTSSRADFGIYLPLLKLIQGSEDIHLTIIAFGTHLSSYHGHTLDEISANGFENIDTVSSLLIDDSPEGIASSYSLTALKFSQYWKEYTYELVLCLGDRFEMQAAIQAGLPFGINYAHFHGGETTEGAIDNIYRHQITLASQVHFTSTQMYSERVAQITGSDKHIYNVGSMSLDGLSQLDMPSFGQVKDEFQMKDGKYILVTFHPETVSFEKNIQFAQEMFDALDQLSEELNLVITLPNADTLGKLFREKEEALAAKKPDRVTLVHNFGKYNYFAVLKNADLVLGNSSSGIIEAASFGARVVNVGDRQAGRAQSKNVIDAPFEASNIVKSCLMALEKGRYSGENIYYKDSPAKKVYELLRSLDK